MNNAGVTRPQPLNEITERDWDEVMAVNLKSRTGQTINVNGGWYLSGPRRRFRAVFDLLFSGAGAILLATCPYLNRRRRTRGFRAWQFLRALPLTIFLLVALTVFRITVAKFWK